MVSILSIDDGFDPALAALRAGELVAVPTETVYGLAADASSEDAVQRIFAAKGRPDFNPLIAHVSDLAMARRVGQFDDLSLELAKAFWPGPLTIVVPLKTDAGIAPAVTAGLGTIALRQPKGVMVRLAEALGNPIAAPSANSSGKISPTLANHVAGDLGDKVSVILDDGPCSVGLESTIVRAENNALILLREGGISRERLTGTINAPLIEKASKAIEAPGQLLSHYAPSLPLRLEATSVRDSDALLAFGRDALPGTPLAVRNLSVDGDLGEAAHNLFAMMKELDQSGARAIAVQSVPRHGIGLAINDRLARAAHGNRDV